MACGYGACFGCAVPCGDGRYLRLCVDGPVVRPLPTGGGGAVGGTTPEDALATAGGGGSPAATGPAGPATIEFCGIELAHPVINASGTFDAIAARRVYGDELLEEFPFSAFVSKTITPEPRAGNEPQRIWETPAGMINSIGSAEQGAGGVSGRGPAAVGGAAGAADRLGDGNGTRGVRAPRERRGGEGRGCRNRAQRVLPQRPLRPDRRRAADRDRGTAGSVCGR